MNIYLDFYIKQIAEGKARKGVYAKSTLFCKPSFLFWLKTDNLASEHARWIILAPKCMLIALLKAKIVFKVIRSDSNL